ncbi:T9SS type A sorting domain-containing protein [Chryseobacterium sp. GMJ5]|uniref:T9SS type A sorting domain-containing protein n=1 Tax=Chryseobacterium gilvum TaxID=2976534 RepID=A0ABT2VXY8_9FLAO|nr:T9SS type A sorting domain-containing protein [Chryseobacterium gilvum]MCU7613787.1 T9SS type A sorting domain-containing protein [Chryseobacterium gilvum]
MRKILLPLLLGFCMANAQTIATENFTSLTTGNLSTDVTGTTAGQGGYYAYGGAASDYQIATIDAAHGNSLKLTSGNGYSATANTFNRFAFKSITATALLTNDILRGTLEIYTGPATGAGKIQAVLYDATSGIVGINYDYATKKISGMGRLTLVSTGVSSFYTIGLGTATYPANTWVSVSFTYNKTTGAYSWTYPEGTYSFTNASYSLNPGLTPTEYDFVSVTSTGNTVANQAAIDNVNLQFTNAATLATSDIKAVKNASISIYPNPTNDFINIKSDSKISNIEVFDVAGRKMDIKADNNKVDVRNLTSGSYMITFENREGKTTEKFIKK